jgi:hypothetical protein
VKAPAWPLPAWFANAHALSDRLLAAKLRRQATELVDAARSEAVRYQNRDFDSQAERAVLLEAAHRLMTPRESDERETGGK